MRLTAVGKAVILIVAIGLAFGVFRYWNKIAPSAATKTASVPKIASVPSMNTSSSSSTSSNGFDDVSTGGCSNNPEIRVLGYAWNAQMGMLLANGGAQAGSGSIMCRRGVNLRWARQDMNDKLQENLITFATELSKGVAQPTKGVHFVTIMGDGGAAFLDGLNKSLGRLGPEYKAKIIDAIGYSRGEDKFMGPEGWKSNPAASKGGVVAGVLRDGDWNIALKWLSDNGLKTNPDEKTWDPDALNWIAANDYMDATEKYITGYTEERDVVRDGKKTGEKKTIKVDGVVTWTPGDVAVATKKGGLVSIVSTKEYSSQMPCIVIGIDKWMRQNKKTVEDFILAVAEGSNEIKNNPSSLRRGAQIVNKAFAENGTSPEYWEKYFKGVTQKDMQGLTVELGGSSVNDLADSMLAFGLAPNSANLVATTYTVFGDLVVQQYPDIVPSYPPATEVIDTQYLRGAAQRTKLTRTVIVKAQKGYRAPRKSHGYQRVIGHKPVYVTFNPGSASFTPQARQMLEKVARDLLVAAGTTVEIHGHTDNQGNNPGKSMTLSKARALAVKRWLENRAPVNFPGGSIQAFWHGESQPRVRANNPAAWAQNRRVEIVLKAG